SIGSCGVPRAVQVVACTIGTLNVGQSVSMVFQGFPCEESSTGEPYDIEASYTSDPGWRDTLLEPSGPRVPVLPPPPGVGGLSGCPGDIWTTHVVPGPWGSSGSPALTGFSPSSGSVG